MKHPLLSLSAGAVTLAIPLQMLAAFTTPSGLFWAWATMPGAQDISAEAHLQMPKEQVFVSVWTKGVQESGLSMSNDGSADITVDVVAPSENINARLKMSVLAVDGDAYVKLNSVSGKMDKDIATLSAEITGKQWVMLPKDEVLGMSDDPFEAISQQLMMTGVEVSAADIRNLVSEVLDAGFSLRATKTGTVNEYTVTPKRGFVKEIQKVIASFGGGDMAWMSDADMRKAERDFLQQVKMGATVRIDGTNEPMWAQGWITFKPKDADVSFDAKMTVTPHKGAFSLKAPAGAISAEEFVQSLDGLGGSPFNSWSAPSMEPSWEEDATWESDDMTWDPCEGMSPMERIQATRKGLCGDQTVSSPRRR